MMVMDNAATATATATVMIKTAIHMTIFYKQYIFFSAVRAARD
jgi:hypothetical protein